MLAGRFVEQGFLDLNTIIRTVGEKFNWSME